MQLMLQCEVKSVGGLVSFLVHPSHVASVEAESLQSTVTSSFGQTPYFTKARKRCTLPNYAT